MTMFRIAFLLIACSSFVRADDWSGKYVQVQKAGLKTGRKDKDNLIRDGWNLPESKSYLVRSDDGKFLELTAGFILKSEAKTVDAPPIPKTMITMGPASERGDWFRRTVVPRRDPKSIRLAVWKDDKLVEWTPKEISGRDVLEDNGDYLRIYDGERTGWLAKELMVIDDHAPNWWDHAIQFTPQDSFPWWNRGRIRLIRRDNDKAIKDFDEAIRLGTTQFQCYHLRGQARLNLNQYDTAIKDFNKAIELGAKSAECYFDRGRAWNATKEAEKAIADFSEAIRFDPKDGFFYTSRGTAYELKNDYERAIRDHTEAIRLLPNLGFIYFRRAMAHMDLKEYQKAIEDFDESIRIDKDGHKWKGICLVELKKHDLAIRCFDDAVKLNPKDDYSFYLRGRAWADQKEYAKAIQDFTEAIRLNPKDTGYLHSRVLSYWKTDDYEHAIQDSETIIRINPKETGTLVALVILLTSPNNEKFKDAKRALGYGRKLIELEPKNWEFRQTLARAYMKNGDGANAVAEQQKAIELLKEVKGFKKEDLEKAEELLQLYRPLKLND